MAVGPYDIIFSGVILKDRSPEEVKRNIGKLFQADKKRLARLFSGKPMLIKTGVDRQTAAKYQATFKKAGAVCRIRQNNSSAGLADSNNKSDQSLHSNTPAVHQPTPVSGHRDTLSIAPVGADVTDPVQEQQYVTPDISAITMAEVGADVLEHTEEVFIEVMDTSSITIADVGADLLDETVDNDPEPPDTDFIELSPPGVDLLEDDDSEPLPFPDVSNITLIDQNND